MVEAMKVKLAVQFTSMAASRGIVVPDQNSSHRRKVGLR